MNRGKSGFQKNFEKILTCKNDPYEYDKICFLKICLHANQGTVVP